MLGLDGKIVNQAGTHAWSGKDKKKYRIGASFQPIYKVEKQLCEKNVRMCTQLKCVS